MTLIWPAMASVPYLVALQATKFFKMLLKY